MRHFATVLVLSVFTLLPLPAMAQQDSSGCKDHPLFNRMPNHYIASCNESPFEARKFPVGPQDANGATKLQEVEGKWFAIAYRPNEGTKSSALQVQRNFQNAAKAAGGTIEGAYGEWCKFRLDESFKLGNPCTNLGTTLKFAKDGKETWVFVNATSSSLTGYDDGYTLFILEREAMSQDIVANELLDRINKDGMIALYLNFDTGSATLQASSNSQIDQIAAMLKAAPSLNVEIGGHTDNVGNAAANQKLSEARAAAVATALTSRGIPSSRITAVGYGQTTPIADNRTEDGRAKNRRVELVKK
jgi:OOP family OmpA-OmpF porin